MKTRNFTNQRLVHFAVFFTVYKDFKIDWQCLKMDVNFFKTKLVPEIYRE